MNAWTDRALAHTQMIQKRLTDNGIANEWTA